jgi:hypothetical protein
MEDLGKTLTPVDYTENIYISIRNVGNKVFRKCAYHEAENFTFIWTVGESFMMDKKEMGDFVVVPYEHTTHASLKKVSQC